MTETVLKLGDVHLPAGSARGITQSLSLVQNGELRRTVNGALIDLTREQNRKFTSSVNATDTAGPAIQGMWRGQELVVECIQPFRQTVNPAALTADLIRQYVTGTVRGRRADGTWLTPTGIVFPTATFAQTIILLEYRPILTMLISDISWDNDEYAVDEGWSIELEEV